MALLQTLLLEVTISSLICRIEQGIERKCIRQLRNHKPSSNNEQEKKIDKNH